MRDDGHPSNWGELDPIERAKVELVALDAGDHLPDVSTVSCRRLAIELYDAAATPTP